MPSRLRLFTLKKPYHILGFDTDITQTGSKKVHRKKIGH
jgi:hypothetical protein